MKKCRDERDVKFREVFMKYLWHVLPKRRYAARFLWHEGRGGMFGGEK